MSRRISALLFAALAVASMLTFAYQPPGASAVDIIEPQEVPGDSEPITAGFQAGPCTLNADPEPPAPPGPVPPPPPNRYCSAKTPDLFFKQAGGHPPKGFVQIRVKRKEENGMVVDRPAGQVKTLLVDLPAGTTVNPRSTPRCQKLIVQGPMGPEPGCPENTRVGYVDLKAWLAVTPVDTIDPGLPIYNMDPRFGEPATFAAALPNGLTGLIDPIILNARIDEKDYHEYFTIHAPTRTKELTPGEPTLPVEVDRARLVFDGEIGLSSMSGTPPGALLTLPTTCENPEVEPFKDQYSTKLHADSVEEPVEGSDYDVAAPGPPSASFLAGSEEVVSPVPKGQKAAGCDQIPFEPKVSVAPGITQTDSPAGAEVEVSLPFDPGAAIYQSHLKAAQITMPAGLGINPAAGERIVACPDSRFHKGSSVPNACPAASEVGTVSIETPPLPQGSLKGKAYVGEQLSRDPASGEQFRLFLEARSERDGIVVRLIANVKADPRTGQLTAVLNDLPQVPFTSVNVDLEDGPKAVLSSPDVCGPHKTTDVMTAWSKSPDQGPADPGFALTGAPGAGPCPDAPGQRGFSPSFSATPGATAAAAPTSLALNVARGDGQQELKGIDITLPPGFTAKLAGMPYCPEAAIAAAAARSGDAESKGPSCPEASRLGLARIATGSGPQPLRVDGKVYFAGPYKGAPLSLVVLTPAVAGPFDLGTVVVRAALHLDPETAQVRAVSDPIPHIFGGAKLDVRAIDLKIDRPGFLLNGTGCAPAGAAGLVYGGGADPGNPAAFSSRQVAAGMPRTGCDALGFKPKLAISLKGGKKRNAHPRLKATLTARPGDANTAVASVALPKALILDQSKLGQICTRVQFAAKACPAKSVYGFAKATSPLVDQPLEGSVVLRSSDSKTPDLVADLRNSQVDRIALVAKTGTFKGGITTTFTSLPDVPVTSFTMTIPGGKKGLLVATRSLCAKPVKAIVKLKGHNGKDANRRTKLRVPCKKRKGAKRGTGKGGRG